MAQKDKTRLVFNEHGKLLGATHHAGYRRVRVFDMETWELKGTSYSEKIDHLVLWLINNMQEDKESREALDLIERDKEKRGT